MDRARNAEAAGATAFAEMKALLEAINAERHLQDELKRVNKETQEAARVEKTAHTAVVVGVRAMSRKVQSFFANEPGVARRLLGHGDPVATRRRNARLATEAEEEKRAKEEAAAADSAFEAATEAAVEKAIEPKKADAPCADASLSIAPVSPRQAHPTTPVDTSRRAFAPSEPPAVPRATG